MASKRCKHQIVVDILTVCKERSNTTRIMRKANLPGDFVKEYTDDLVEQKVLNVIIDDNQKFFTVTNQGLILISLFANVGCTPTEISDILNNSN